MAAQILLVEDNEDLREITAELLCNSGYLVITSNNGQEALEQFKKHKFDLIITDIYMPVMDGNKFIQELERYAEFTEVPPLIAVSYNHFDILPNRVISQAALKPLKSDQLRALILNVLEKINGQSFKRWK